MTDKRKKRRAAAWIIAGTIAGGIAVTALAGAMMVSGEYPAHAATVTPYQIDPSIRAGNQTWAGSFGQDFTVLRNAVTTYLGAWEINPAGLQSNLTISLYDRTDPNNVTRIVSQTFTPDQPGTPAGSSGGAGSTPVPGFGGALPSNVFFKSIAPTPLLAGHRYSLIADGYGNASDPLFNTQGTGLAGTLDDGKGTFGFEGWRYGNTPNEFPPTTFANSGCCSGDSPFRFAGPTFIAEVPEPATLALFVTGLLGLAVLARGRRQAGQVVRARRGRATRR